MSEEITLKPKVFWAWNGLIEDGRVREDIRSFKEQGIGGFYIHSRCGLVTPYMGEEWFRAIETAVDEAEKLGLEVWLYDEDGWPSGFAGGKVVKLSHDFWRTKIFLKNSNVLFLPECEKDDIVAMYEETDKNSAKFFCGGKYYRSVLSGMCNVLIYKKRERYYVDLLNPEVTDAFINVTHEEYKKRLSKYFGKTIKGIFTDEPQAYASLNYNGYLASAYEKRYGEPLCEAIIKSQMGTEKERFIYRGRYFEIMYPQFKNSYYEKLNSWCQENGLYFCGHGPCEDGLMTQSEMAGNMALNYTSMSYPGIDFLGRRLISAVPLKILNGVKNQLGLKYTQSETFGCSGWGSTFADYRRIWAYQAANGINTACMHLSAYSITGNKKRDYPGFFSVQSESFSHLMLLTSYMENIGRFISFGKQKCKIAVISALRDCAAFDQFREDARKISNSFRILCESLDDLQVGYDVVDEYILEKTGAVNNGSFAVGKMNYSVVIVPEVSSLKKSTIRILDKFSDAGGKILFTGAFPFRDENYHCDEIQKLTSKYLIYENFNIVMNRASLWKKAFEYHGISEPIRLIAKEKCEMVKEVLMRVSENEEIKNVLFFNKSLSDFKKFTVECDGIYSVCTQDLYENTTCEVSAVYGNGITLFDIELPSGEALAFVLKQGQSD